MRALKLKNDRTIDYFLARPSLCKLSGMLSLNPRQNVAEKPLEKIVLKNDEKVNFSYSSRKSENKKSLSTRFLIVFVATGPQNDVVVI